MRCGEGKCEGYLLEQRPDNLTDGEAWACTACSRSVPSLPPPGSDMDPAKYPGAVTEQFKLTWNQCITLQQTKVFRSPSPLGKASCNTWALLRRPSILQSYDNVLLLDFLFLTTFDHFTYTHISLPCRAHRSTAAWSLSTMRVTAMPGSVAGSSRAGPERQGVDDDFNYVI